MEQGHATEWKPQRQEYLVILTLTMVSLMAALDAAILVSALETIATKLHGKAIDTFWVGTSYLLACTVCQPFISALSDIFGRQELLLPSLVLFTIGALICSLAQNFTVLLIGRSIQGIGGGGIITMVQVIFADIVPLRQRPKYWSIVLAGWSIGSLMGPLTGALFAQEATWRWVFYINFPFCGLGFLMIPLFVKLETTKTSFVERLMRVDWMGGFLFIGGLTTFLIPITWGGIQFPWNSASTIVPLVLGTIGVFGSLVWEKYKAKEPFLRKSLFNNVSAIAAYICALCQGLILFCGLYYVPFYFISVKFTSTVASGVNFFPVTAFLLPGAAVTSSLITRLGRFRWALWLGWTFATTGAGLFILLDVNTRTAVWATSFVVYGLGHGMILSAVNFAIQTIADPVDAGRAASMYAFVRTLGMSIGVAVGGSVFQNQLNARLHDLGVSDADHIARNAEAYVKVLTGLKRNDPTRVVVVAAYAHGFRGVWIVMTGISALGLLASVCVRRHSMDKELETEYQLSRR
ncbi:MFS general substrate transporter [Rhizodiscina lignyota]|uniref:MFS general substrate transporter n=1 Tax=Rhizodiscina lignyota TaxID=1504668 RepID=A0A9P4IAN0_9PEZI|nr:MFS general substrate transporter [Rhizodiscina lignyota]